MAVLAIPLLEGAGEAIAAAWSAFVSSGAATATAGGAATAAVLALPGDTAKDRDKAKAEAQPIARTREQRCKCPAEKGTKAPVPYEMSELSARYQYYITGFTPGWEWKFSNKDFDGFEKAKCLLQEAKANYDFFFDNKGKPKFFFFYGKGPKNPGEAKSKPAYDSIMSQAREQSNVVIANPPTSLRWYFMQKNFFQWATVEFGSNGFPITTEHKEMLIKEGAGS
ncbi:hypothetical protein BTH42_32060 [Burkholderia sp. SRS-W-2-2016]|uniref:Tox-REase-5 domain-containing protein n=1 Tax=Burkholderia sp. SRS-W-2-2016 TaxID=1926878 RepID=UPI00094B6E45|nr:Tox-REase-5 domain-containing protein [Burkholderia sp. SRS-W-2-2016]OLL27481.1 hypothetical protein BTH42_32060 [Burkholderia sp. SRS-W-2-2016]